MSLTINGVTYKNAAKALNSRGFYLAYRVDAPIEGVDENTKHYVYRREQTNDAIIFDQQQTSIRLTDTWYSIEELETIVARAKELGIT